MKTKDKVLKDWKMNSLKAHLDMLKKEKVKGTVTRDEIRDVELKFYYFLRGFDITLAEVGKVIKEEIKIQEKMGKEHRQHKRSIEWRIIGLKLVLKKLGIK